MDKLDQVRRWLGDQWQRSDRDLGYDFQNGDGTQVIDVKLASRGVRDLHAALTQLALVVGENRQIERAYLLAQLPRMTKERAELEWERVRQVLRPDAADRLALIGVGAGGVAVCPDDDRARRLAVLAEPAFRRDAGSQATISSAVSAKFFEVWKVLLAAWLAKEGPLQIGEVAERAGCSYPTVATALDRMHDRREIERNTSRSVKLRVFPRQTLREILVLVENLRRPMPFVDATGREPDPQLILRRLRASKPQRVALSGVVAARNYDAHFDLNGLPRLDVMMHEPIDLGWVRDVDPALRRASPREAAPVLVVRPLTRPTAGFLEIADGELPIADPVETLLDLYELRLDAQAGDLIKALRGKGDGE